VARGWGSLTSRSSPPSTRVGSTFTLYLPQIYAAQRVARTSRALSTPGTARGDDAESLASAEPHARTHEPGIDRSGIEGSEPEADGGMRAPSLWQQPAATSTNEVGDDRDNLSLGVPVLLIVENDLAFARFMLEAAREKGFKGIVTSLGVSALALAAEYRPSAVTLDIFLPDIDGWRVLDRLKHDARTRHIAVAVISTEEARERALGAGAFGVFAKPIQSKEILDTMLSRLIAFVQRPEKSLLIITADDAHGQWLHEYLAADDVRVTVAPSYEAGVEIMAGKPVDCMVVDARSSAPSVDMLSAGADGEPRLDSLPIILYGAGQPSQLRRGQGLAGNIRVTEARSPEELLDQASFFLHRAPAGMPETHRKILRELHKANKVLQNKKVMIVDDDMRNIFAVSSLLEDKGMLVFPHDNGRDAVSALQAAQQVDVILMDIMMPEMDGIDTIREIRTIPACKHVPIIAVTAKAMKGDREKCIEAGAWDYLSKPVDSELLVGVLRAWLE
jgi:CheY-like chemotaxis protein